MSEQGKWRWEWDGTSREEYDARIIPLVKLYSDKNILVASGVRQLIADSIVARMNEPERGAGVVDFGQFTDDAIGHLARWNSAFSNATASAVDAIAAAARAVLESRKPKQPEAPNKLKVICEQLAAIRKDIQELMGVKE